MSIGGGDRVLATFSIARVVGAVEEHAREHAAASTRARGGVVEDRPEMLRFVSGEPMRWANGVIGARLTPEEADRWIEGSVNIFREAAVSATWWVGPPSRPWDLGPRLARHGLRHVDTMPWLAAEMDAVLGRAPALPPSLAVRLVEDDPDQEAWLDVMTRGFGLPRTVRTSLGTLARRMTVGHEAGSGPWIRFVGRVEGTPVASSGLMLFGGVAGLYNVATVPSARRRGYGTALTCAALEHARGLGYRIAILGTSATGRGVYERLGFREVCLVEEWAWHPA